MAIPDNLKPILEEHGFAVLPVCLDEETVNHLSRQFDEKQESQRNILSIPVVRELAKSRSVRQLLETVLGPKCFAVRGIFFNKTNESNWKVVWHQDVTIAVRERKDVEEFGPWSQKDGVLHVQPPSQVLGGMVSIRLHLDESEYDNGPLRVIAGSHTGGRLSAEQIVACEKNNEIVCTIPKGGALLMRPLVLHASSACQVSKPRRVIHLEFAAENLPHGLEWYEAV